MECATIRRGYFRGSTAAENTGTFGIAGSVHRPWDSNPSRKNEIECCVDRLNPPPIADIGNLHSIVSLAAISNAAGTVRPSVFAVLRLTTNSNLFGCSTGRSPGF